MATITLVVAGGFVAWLVVSGRRRKRRLMHGNDSSDT